MRALLLLPFLLIFFSRIHPARGTYGALNVLCNENDRSALFGILLNSFFQPDGVALNSIFSTSYMAKDCYGETVEAHKQALRAPPDGTVHLNLDALWIQQGRFYATVRYTGFSTREMVYIYELQVPDVYDRMNWYGTLRIWGIWPKC